MRIIKFEQTDIPSKNGWYWVLPDGYDDPIPCWFSHSEKIEDCYFLPAGLGDSSSMGLYLDEIEKIGPEIFMPKL